MKQGGILIEFLHWYKGVRGISFELGGGRFQGKLYFNMSIFSHIYFQSHIKITGYPNESPKKYIWKKYKLDQ
jgi:hypothetical protein